MKTWTVYIIESKKWDKYYVGVTDNLERRIVEHNKGLTPSTKGGFPWELKHFEEFKDKSKAYKRERFLKKKKSKKILKKVARSPDVTITR